MTGSHASSHIRETIKQELATIIEFESRDPVIIAAFPTVMDVKLSADRRHARVFVALGSADADVDRVMQAFQHDRGFFRSVLADRLEIRHTPELRFVRDTTVERSLHFQDLLDQEDDELAAD